MVKKIPKKDCATYDHLRKIVTKFKNKDNQVYTHSLCIFTLK